MMVGTAKAAATTVHGNKTYYFCSTGCKNKFDADPDQYLNSPQQNPQTIKIEVKQSMPAAEVRGTKYTCPMHPEVIRDKPGSCPKCGMTLEPMEIQADGEEENPELRDMSRRFWIALAWLFRFWFFQ